MSQSRLTRKHQTTVPRPIRETLGLHPGDVLVWQVDGPRVAVSVAQPRFAARRGSIRVGRGDPAADVRRARVLMGRDAR